MLIPVVIMAIILQRFIAKGVLTIVLPKRRPALASLLALPEDIEVKFWNSLVYGATSNAVHTEDRRNLFGLQRFASLQADQDTGPEALDDELLRRTAPKPKADPAALEGPADQKPELTELQKQILANFIGEDISGGRASDKW